MTGVLLSPNNVTAADVMNEVLLFRSIKAREYMGVRPGFSPQLPKPPDLYSPSLLPMYYPNIVHYFATTPRF